LLILLITLGGNGRLPYEPPAIELEFTISQNGHGGHHE
jgi:hypothetical protein